MDKTYILPVPEEYQTLAAELSQQSGKIYSKAISFLRRMNKKGIKISQKTFYRYMEWWIHQRDFILHSQSKQAAYQQAWNNYIATLKKIKKAKQQRKDTTKIKLPYKNKKYNKVCFKKSAIETQNNALVFKNRRNTEKIVLKVKGFKATAKYAELLYHSDKRKYYIHVIIEIEREKLKEDKGILSVDLGVIHPMVCFDGENVLLYNGGVLNSKLRYRNKKIAELQRKMSLCQKSSKRYKKLKRAKKLIRRKINNQIRDVLEKYTSHLVGYSIKNKIGTIVLGDIKGIRNKAKYGKVANQKIHQWLFRRMSKMIERKSKFVGINVIYVKENNTSQVCPVCGNKNKPKNRNYKCDKCGFAYHRDGVGAINIYKKYTGNNSLVVGQLTGPVGVRYKPHLRCPVEWNIHPWVNHSIGKTA